MVIFLLVLIAIGVCFGVSAARATLALVFLCGILLIAALLCFAPRQTSPLPAPVTTSQSPVSSLDCLNELSVARKWHYFDYTETQWAAYKQARWRGLSPEAARQAAGIHE